MDAYRLHMKSLRGQMNDHEDQLAVIATEHSQTQTEVRHLQKDLESVLAESERAKVDIESFRKESDEASNLMISSQKKLENLNTDAQLYSNAMELVRDDIRKQSSNLSKTKTYFDKIRDDARARLKEQKAYYESHPVSDGGLQEDINAVNTSPTGELQTGVVQNDTKMDEGEHEQNGSRLDQVEHRLSKIKEEIQLAEGQLKLVTDQYAQLEAGNRVLEDELEALKEDNLAEQEYMQSLYDRLGQLRGYSQDVVCGSCRHAYSIQCQDSEVLVCEASGEK